MRDAVTESYMKWVEGGRRGATYAECGVTPPPWPPEKPPKTLWAKVSGFLRCLCKCRKELL